MKSYEIQFLYALGVTVSVETVVLMAVVRFLYRYTQEKLPLILLIASGVVASAATLPYLWFVLPPLLHSRLQLIIAGEAGVTVVEALIYVLMLKIDIKRAFLVSLLCNISSILAGLILKI